MGSFMRKRKFLLSRLAVGMAVIVSPALAQDPAADPSRVFEERILPIFKSPRPSSCVECHLSGVDLKDYILPDARATFLSLRDQGLIDLEVPERSKIVGLIDMKPEARAEGPTIRTEMRMAEREAFVAWIRACAANPELRDAPRTPTAPKAGPERPVEVIRHARKDRLLASFEQNVWAWRFRCMNCHTEGTPQNEKYRGQHGDRVAWVKKAGAEATLDYLLASELIDTEDPESSLLLLKPMGEEEHKGGTKFSVGDEAYKGFRTWIEDVAAIRGGRYKQAADLPAASAGPARFGTEHWLKLTSCPPEWGDKLLEVRIHAWDPGRGEWETEPVATSDRLVSAQAKLWQHNLTLLAPEGSERARAWQASGHPSLPEGRYLVEVFVDRDAKLARDWKASLGPTDLVGQAEIRTAWGEGYGKMTSVDAGGLATRPSQGEAGR